MNSWQYFRKEVTGPEIPEIYTDNESKMLKYKRLCGLLAAFIPLMVVNIINSLNISYHPAARFMTVMSVFMLFFMGIGLARLFHRIQQLKRI
jgi:fatty-acid desaturase